MSQDLISGLLSVICLCVGSWLIYRKTKSFPALLMLICAALQLVFVFLTFFWLNPSSINGFITQGQFTEIIFELVPYSFAFQTFFAIGFLIHAIKGKTKQGH